MAKFGLKQYPSALVRYRALVRAEVFQFDFLFLSSSLVKILGSGSRQTIFKFPNFAKPYTLPAMRQTYINNNPFTEFYKAEDLAKSPRSELVFQFCFLKFFGISSLFIILSGGHLAKSFVARQVSVRQILAHRKFTAKQTYIIETWCRQSFRLDTFFKLQVSVWKSFSVRQFIFLVTQCRQSFRLDTFFKL